MAVRALIAYIVSLIIFLFMDIGWVTLVVSPLYKSQLGSLVLEKPSMPPAVLFYLLFMAGLVFFAVVPGLRAQSWSTALINGAAYGFFTYVTYSLTNLAVLRGWTTMVAGTDIIWGAFVSGATATASYFITSWLKG